MLSESLELQIAENQIQHFEEEVDPVMRDHYDAEDCCNCEKFLQLGIDAYKWLSRAEESLLLADAEGLMKWTPQLENAVKLLYQRWLGPCEKAENWILRVEKSGFEIENLARFRECCQAVKQWIERNSAYEVSKATALERLAEEPW